MGKIEENKYKKQARLLETAFSLFTTKGIAKTSISDIVNHAGVAKGTFYLYFQDKYDIANKLIARKARSLCLQSLQRLERSDIADPIDRLIFMVDTIIDELQRNPLLLQFINKNLSWGIFRNALSCTESERDIPPEALLSRVFLSDIDNWTNVEAMLYIIIEMVGSTCHSVILDSDPLPLDEFKPHLYRSIRAIATTFRAPS